MADKVTERIFYNSALQYPLHKWNLSAITSSGVAISYPFKTLAQQNRNANAVSFYPWTTGTELALAMNDRAFWRDMLLRIVSMDFSKCMTVSPFGNQYDRCDTYYAGSTMSVVEAIAEYVFLTSDTTILSAKVGSETVIDRIAKYMNLIDPDLVSAGRLKDFGSDPNLYELGHHNCNLGGYYNGQVPDMNAARYNANRNMSLLYGKVGNLAAKKVYEDKANANKAAFNTMWNDVAGWYDTYSIYETTTNASTAKKYTAPKKTTFYLQPVFHAMTYEGLMPDDYESKMFANFGRFVGSRGFYSMPKDTNAPDGSPYVGGARSCYRTDWHGPGLYSGAIGKMFEIMFDRSKEDAYKLISSDNISNGYGYVSQLPVLAQQYSATSPIIENGRSLYIEAIAFQQAMITHLMGLVPDEDVTWINPRIPDGLKNKGTVKFDKIISQTHEWSLTINPSDTYYSIDIEAAKNKSPIPHFRFGYGGDRSAKVTIRNIENGEYFVRYDSATSPPIGGAITVSNNTLVADITSGKKKVYITK